ncbi:hypothetical protein IV203_009189 [Nitzschia inconspicua]|uniref:Uncharacterized protein n=1 Tax=Nitzschia inconspicua TaxID=303405 RepID=A0A9K3PNE5_9STRA|nr:hypothetical protein IV203_009189 [Nitzschia inconspicua]
MKFINAASLLFCFSPALAFDGSISADTELGRKLLGKARQLNNNNNNYNYYSWMGSASLKFDGCVSIPSFEREDGIRNNLVAKFRLCPDHSCGTCRNAGEYIVEMREFVDVYQDAQREANEAECETAQYNCEYKCQNGNYNYNGNNGNNYYQNQNNGENNGEYCTYQCLMDQGLDYCFDEQDQVDMNEFAECRAMNEKGGQNNNNNYYNGNGAYQMYYIGAYCTSSGVYAGVFTDSTCTKHAPSGTYEKYNYGYSLPTKPLVSSDCISCSAYNNNGNNNNNNNNGGIGETCQKLYEQSLKCESNLNGVSYKDTSGCELIHTILPKLNSAIKGLRAPTAAKVCAWTFGIGFFALAGYLFLLHRKVMRQKRELEAMGYTEAPYKGGVHA